MKDTATRWESTGEGEYTLEDTERDTQGTTVTLDLLPADSEGGLEDFTASMGALTYCEALFRLCHVPDYSQGCPGRS